MKVLNYTDFAAFNYIQSGDISQLGNIVINRYNEIGVIIQVHEDTDIRTDMFGNCSLNEIRLATLEEIEKFQPDIINHLTKSIPKFTKYIAVAIKDNYWVALSKPCDIQEATSFKGKQMKGEKFAIKTEIEFNSYNKTIS